MTTSLTILVFDTQDDSRESVVQCLNRLGHGVVASGDGQDALEQAEDWVFDLAIVQWGDPELDGLEIACRVKQRERFVPVIWLGQPGAADAIRGFVRNTDGFVSRPVDISDFELQINALIEKKLGHDANVTCPEELPGAFDTLTGLPRRSALLEQLSRAVELGEADQSPLAVLLIDVDDFGRVNDQVGFELGNVVLRLVAERIRLGLRSVDTLFRLGGDELAAVLPFTDDVGAVIAAERLREDVQVHTFTVGRELDGARGAGDDGADHGESGPPTDADAYSLRLTISIGVAASTLLGYDADALLRLADEALGAAKTKTNRVVLGGH